MTSSLKSEIELPLHLNNLSFVFFIKLVYTNFFYDCTLFLNSSPRVLNSVPLEIRQRHEVTLIPDSVILDPITFKYQSWTSSSSVTPTLLISYLSSCYFEWGTEDTRFLRWGGNLFGGFYLIIIGRFYLSSFLFLEFSQWTFLLSKSVKRYRVF